MFSRLCHRARCGHLMSQYRSVSSAIVTPKYMGVARPVLNRRGIFCRCTLTSRHENEEELDRLRKQAEEGGPEEKIIVAHILEFGTGAAGNSETSLNHKEEALMWYKRAAQEGNARATWSFAVLQRALAKMDEEKLVIELLRKRVEEGDEACAGELGVRYYFGNGVPKNTKLAYPLLKLGLNRKEGNTSAEAVCVGLMYQSGTFPISEKTPGVSDVEMAKQFFRKAAEQGEQLGNIYLAGILLREGHVKEAIELLERAAATGEIKSAMMLGDEYFLGSPQVPRNLPRAAFFFEKVFHSPKLTLDILPYTAYMLGRIYSQPEMGPRPDRAVKFFEVAAQQGHPASLYQLGTLYYHGSSASGITKNSEKAVEYFSEAARRGHTGAMNSLGWLLLEEKRVLEAMELFKKSTSEVPNSFYGLAYIQYYGLNGQRDLVEATKNLRAGAGKGSRECLTMLGLCYVNGEGIEENFEKGMGLLKLAAEKGDPNAKLALQRFSEIPQTPKSQAQPPANNKEVPPELQGKVEEMRKSAESGNRDSLVRLAFLLLKYESTIPEAIDLLKKAAELGEPAAAATVGTIYFNGTHGMKEDPLSAEKYLQQTFDSDFFPENEKAPFAFMLGVAHLLNDKDYHLAEEYFKFSLKFGTANAETPKALEGLFQVAIRHRHGSGKFPKDIQKYEELSEFLVERGHMWATHTFAQHLAETYGKNSESLKRAIELWKISSSEIPNSFSGIGHVYFNGMFLSESEETKETERDRNLRYREAVKWYRLGAGQGDGDCLVMLGGCYYNGQGVERDREKGKELIRKAVEAGMTSAETVLAELEELERREKDRARE